MNQHHFVNKQEEVTNKKTKKSDEGNRMRRGKESKGKKHNYCDKTVVLTHGKKIENQLS